MADSGDGLDLLLALADDPEGHDVDPRPVMEQHIESPNTAEPNIADEDDMDILCRMADEAEDAMVPGSPGAADVPFDPDHDVPSDSPHPNGVGSSKTALQSKPRSPAHSALTLAPHGNTAASVANSQQKGRSAFLGIRIGDEATGRTSSGAGWVEKRTGLRVKDPKYSSVVLNERLSEIAYISVSSIAQAAGRDAPWAVVGVLSEKLPIRAASTGKPYSLWVLSDLNGASVKLFLFGDAHDEHRQLSQGSLLAAWGGKVRMEGAHSSLTLFDPEQLMHIGAAADFGTCRSTRKDGLRCTVGVNVAKCPFCEFHVAKEYKKMAPRRGGFTDSLLPTGFSRGGATGQPYAGGRRMVSTKLTAANPPPRMRQHSAADMAAIAQRDVGRRDGVGRRYMLSQAQAVAQHVGQRSGAKLPPVRAMASSQPAAGASDPSGRSSAQSSAAKTADVQPSGRPMPSLTTPGSRADGRGPGDAGAAVHSRHSSAAEVGGTGARQLADQRIATSAAARAAAVARGAKRKAPDAAARDVSTCSQAPSPAPPASGAPSSSGVRLPALDAQPAGSGGTNLMDLETEPTLEEDEAMWHRPQQPQALASRSVSDAQQQRQQQQQRKQAASQPQQMSQPAQGQRPALRQQQPNQQGRPRSESYLRAVAALRGAGSQSAVKASKRVGARQQANPNLPQLQKRVGPGSKRYDMSLGPAQHAVSTSKARAPLAARLDAAEAGRSVAALAAERSRQTKRAAAAAPARASFAASFAGIGGDDIQQSRYQHIADAEEEEELLRVMDGLDRKDAAASRMDDIKVEKVTAWKCASCNYTAEFAAKTCREAGHELLRLSTTKRWWRCNSCSHHFTTVGVRYPASRCPKCDGPEPSFRAASMLRGAKGPQELPFASREGFKARGTEHGFCLKC